MTMFSRRARDVAGFLAAIFLMLATPAWSSEPMILPVDPAPLVVESAGGSSTFSIEIADDNEERGRGLMFRKDMADDRGMLFVFENTRQVGFWMKNTPMPLDLIFIGEDGVVLDVLPGEPFSEAPIGPRAPVRFVLEVKRGIAMAAGIEAGMQVRHPVIDAIAQPAK